MAAHTDTSSSTLINILPDEILAHIFETGAGPMYHGLMDLYFSFRVSWVCRRWRRVALSTPVLWTSLELTQPSREVEHPLQQRLSSRWGAVPLRIRVFMDDSDHLGGERQYFADMLGDLAPLLPRTTLLVLHAFDIQHTEIMSEIPLPPAPLLTRLQVFGSLPSVAYLLAFLALCPNLRALYLGGVDFGLSEIIPIITELPRLHTLQLQDGDLRSAPVLLLFRFLRTPNIRNLELITDSGGLPENELEEVYSVVSTAKIRGMSFEDTNLFSVLRRMPGLKALFLNARIENILTAAISDARLPALSHIVLRTPPIWTHGVGLLELENKSMNLHIQKRDCACMDAVARALVESNTDAARGRTSLQGLDFSRCPCLSLSTKEWIRQRVPDWPISEQGTSRFL